ncbi:MAG: Plug domain-containing protein, partial [Sinobacteraceae bacterium]|nr:Plug domain-containing protein [Nevskiaceae bacterium]
MKAPSIAHARCGAICLCTALLCLPTSAWSATPAAEELPAVVVTSEKIAQPIQQVPASVSVMGGQEIKHTGTTDFHQLQAYIPNASISLSPDSGQFSIRGFATPDSNPGFDPSVGTVIDGVFYNRPQFLSAFFYDIGSFQVLRGPQGTLFGKNASAGVFELHTAAPRNRPMFRMEYLMSSDGGRSLRPVGQIGIGNTLSIRAA